MTTKTLRIVVTGLLLASAALFAVGVAVERHSENGEHHAALGTDHVLVADEHAGEGGEEGGAEEPHAAETPTHRAGEKNRERVFGIDIESPALVAAAVIVSLLLAVALWLSGSVLAPLAVASFALVATIFDVREVFHQIDESRTNLTVIAAVVAALHLAVFAGALILARRMRGSSPATVST